MTRSMLLQLMGGRIWLESDGLGKGTACKFYIAIGMYQNVKTTVESPKNSPGPVGLKDVKVMHQESI